MVLVSVVELLRIPKTGDKLLILCDVHASHSV